MNPRIAALQMISGPAVAGNLATAERLLAQAAEQGATLAALPEYFPLIGASDGERLAAREDEHGGPIQEFLARCARRWGLWLVAGSIPMFGSDPARMRNACLVFDPEGRQVARYDKIHLFGFRKGDEQYDEAATIEPGDSPRAVALPWGRMGLAICYDLRFPELFRALAPVDLLVIPAAFTETTGRAHWEMLLRARAVENQCYVMAPAQGGRHPGGRLTHGNTMIIDPWGEVVARFPDTEQGAGKGEGLVIADLDLARIAEVRQNLPALRHRRL